MTVCEVCGGMGYTPKTYHGQPRRVLCGCCLGTGLICLGYESRGRYDVLRAAAQARAIAEGWLEVAWDGEPGNARKVLKPCAPVMAEQPARKSA